MNKKKNNDAVEILKNRYIKNDAIREASIEEERINANVARLIYILRTDAGMTQTELAEKVNTTQSVISRLEDSDYKGHSLSMLQKICKTLGRKINITIVNDELNDKTLKDELNEVKLENQFLKNEIQNFLNAKIEVTVSSEVKKQILEIQTSSSFASDEKIKDNYNEIENVYH